MVSHNHAPHIQTMRYIKAAAQAIKPTAILPNRNIIHADPHLHSIFSVSMILFFM